MKEWPLAIHDIPFWKPQRPMQNVRSTIPWMLVPIVRLIRWGRQSLGRLAGGAVGHHGSSDLGGALFLVGVITLTAGLGAPPLLTVGGGLGLAVLFVVARSCVVAQESPVA